MIDDATETTTIRPLTEDELHAVAGGFSVYRYLEGVGEVVTGINDIIPTALNPDLCPFSGSD